MEQLAEIKIKSPDARHHCWAYLIGSPDQPRSLAMADDGEPSGTAGKPILNVLQHKNVGDVMVVVTRYFGGIKLGAGGLVRAYSAAAQQVMEQLETKQEVSLHELSLDVDFKHEQFVRHLTQQFQGKIQSCNYAHCVTMTLALPEQRMGDFEAHVAAIRLST